MKFVISRTSLYNDECPLTGAELYMMPFERADGKVRDIPIWVMEVPDILEFVRQNGQCVVKARAHFVPDLPEIELYDDYRE